MQQTIRPSVVAHRGASHDVAEHTLAAYVAALDHGADGLECDVRLTADGHLVCVHDRDLRRTASNPGTVSTMNLADLDQLDFSSWKHPWAELDDEAPDIDEKHGGLLTLRTLLQTAADYDRRVEIAVETKHPTRFAGLVERRLVELLRSFNWDLPGSPVRVMSFSHTALRRIERHARGLQVVQLIDKAAYWPVVKRLIGPEWAVGPGIDLLTEHPRLARRIARSGHEVHVWTVNTAEQLELCLELGVRAVISDRPAYVRELLGPTAEANGTDG